MSTSMNALWHSVLIGITLIAGSSRLLQADPPLAGYLFPAGGQRGTAVSLHVGGCNLHDECELEMDGLGVELDSRLRRSPKTTWFEGPTLNQSNSQASEDYPKDYTSRANIRDDASCGIHHWRVWTSQGVTPAMKFVVGDLPEIVEEELDGEPIPVPVSLPLTINGRIFPREDVDVWTFPAVVGESITCEVNAARLGSPLIARLELIGPDGRSVAEGLNNLGNDARIRFHASQAGTYQLKIHDIRFGGSQCHVYRLTVTNRPYVDSFFPLGGRRGTTPEFQLTGQGLPREPQPIPLDADKQIASIWKTTHVASEVTNPILIQLDDLAEFIEPEVALPSPPSIPLPAVLNGRIRCPGEKDDWLFVARQGDVWDFDLFAARLDSPLDSVLVLLDEKGRELARSEDIGPAETDSHFQFVVPADGSYTIRVADQFASRGGDRFAYRLRIATPPEADFQLNLSTDALTLVRGAETSVKVFAKRIGGFNGEIQIRAENLPSGVTAFPAKFESDAREIDCRFQSSNSAKIQMTHIRVLGEALINGKSIIRTATFPVSRGEPAIDFLSLAVALSTPFKYVGRTSIEYVPSGTSLKWHFRLERGGFQGPIEIELADRQFRHLMGLTASRLTVPPGVDEFDYPVHLPPWTLLGRTGRAVIAASGTIVEPDGSQHLVSFSTHNDDDQIVVLAGPPLLTLDTLRKSIIASPGSTVTLPIKIGRSARLGRSPVKVELLPAEHMRGVTARPCEISGATSDCRFEIQFSEGEIGPWNTPLIIRASTDIDGTPVTAETRLSVASE